MSLSPQHLLRTQRGQEGPCKDVCVRGAEKNLVCLCESRFSATDHRDPLDSDTSIPMVGLGRTGTPTLGVPSDDL